ncbi:redoxin domain-containing protein [Thioalkalivibrio sulfidiphilus]|uniref:TlpA family protein disulfide reductase n=1 Tax=Thioalkalivibrio sulfidiphilus TaxID=1033854 RepID=UPI00036C1099
MPRRPSLCLALLLLFSLPHAVLADFNLDLPDGERLDVRVWGGDNTGPLFVWLINQYGETEGPHNLARRLAERNATVWQVDLLDSLLLQRSNEVVRNLDGAPVAALLQKAVESGRGPIVVTTCDRMTVPLLRGLRTWQEQATDMNAVAGGILFFPNLYRGTPVAGEEPELLGIVSATNMPLAILQPELGTNRPRLEELLATLHRAGSPAYGWLVDSVRDYYLLRSVEPEAVELEAMGGPIPFDVTRAILDTPTQLLAATRLLAQTPRSDRPAPLDEEAEAPVLPAFGLVERPAYDPPGYDLVDARGVRHQHTESLGRVTLVNFWATWCPPCVHEIPSMNRLAAAYPEDEFGIVSINFRESPAHILNFMEDVNVDFPVLMDEDGAVSGEWRVFAFPSSFLLDRQGRVRYSVNTAIEWDTEEVREVIDRLRVEDSY